MAKTPRREGGRERRRERRGAEACKLVDKETENEGRREGGKARN